MTDRRECLRLLLGTWLAALFSPLGCRPIHWESKGPSPFSKEAMLAQGCRVVPEGDPGPIRVKMFQRIEWRAAELALATARRMAVEALEFDVVLSDGEIEAQAKRIEHRFLQKVGEEKVLIEIEINTSIRARATLEVDGEDYECPGLNDPLLPQNR